MGARGQPCPGSMKTHGGFNKIGTIPIGTIRARFRVVEVAIEGRWSLPPACTRRIGAPDVSKLEGSEFMATRFEVVRAREGDSTLDPSGSSPT